MTSVTWCEAGPPPTVISAAIQVPVNGANGRGVGATQDETCAHGRSGPHIASCDAPTARRDASHLSWLVVCSPGVRRRWRTVGGSGTVARGSFETRSTRADDAMDSGRTITRINGDRNSIPIATVTNSWVQTPCHRSSVLHASTSFFDAVGAVCGKHFP